MVSLPSGTVTFLFTDVEGSTVALRELGADRYSGELAAHRQALRAACEGHGGVEVDTQGDSLFVAFARAADAVAAAMEAQAATAGTRLRARMGLHTGEPLLTENGYVGGDVHRAARIAAAGHGGQIVVSQTTRELVRDADFVDLGAHRLKDLSLPERLYQLGGGSFPPLRSLNRSNLPVAATPLVDRISEQEELLGLLRAHRLVTVTGAGGSGKTRLALQVAAELTDDYPDGVFFLALAGLTDPELVVPATLQQLGLTATETAPAASVSALVLLDNFEHLSAAAPAVAQLLAAVPGLRLLVTSRTPLRISTEVELPLDPLRAGPAVELFLERARAVGRRLEPDRVLGEICCRLDGLPLALELAAARLNLLDPSALLARLDACLPLLTTGPRDLPERQRTLEATIAWSYDLLEPEAAVLFARLAVFADGFELTAAEAVADADLDRLGMLVDGSLVEALPGGRFLMLATVREFARLKLQEPEWERLADAHAAHYHALAERDAPFLAGAEAAERLAGLDADHANLRAALDRLLAVDPPLAARMTSVLWRFWLVRGHFLEAEARLERALASGPSDAQRGELLYQLSAIVISRGKAAAAQPLLAEALELFRAAGERNGEARCLSALGHAATDVLAWEEGRRFYEQAAAVFRELGDDGGLGGVLGDLATLLLRAGDPQSALGHAEQSLALQRRTGSRQQESLALATIGYAMLATGQPAAAAGPLADSTRLCHQLGYLHGLVFSLNGLGLLACADGDLPGAARAFAAAQRLRQTIGIEHDPDDALVAAARSAVEAQLGHACFDPDRDSGAAFDLDETVLACLEPPQPSPQPAAGS